MAEARAVSPLEKAARALYHAKPRNKPWDVLPVEFQRQYVKQVVAVLEAIAEPDDEMIEAGHLSDPLGCDVDHAKDVYPPVYRAMIQSILDRK